MIFLSRIEIGYYSPLLFQKNQGKMNKLLAKRTTKTIQQIV